MTSTRRHFMQAGASTLASAMAFAWARPALGKEGDLPPLMKDAEELYRRSTVIDMVSETSLDEKGLGILQGSGVTCISPTLGVRKPEKAEGTYMLRAFPPEAAVEDCAKYSRFIAANPAVLVAVLKAEDIRRAKQEGKTAIMLNFQNCPIGDDLDNLDMFHSMGVRSIQVTYNERNLLGDGSTERTDSGLSDFGIAAVERMNALGILVDSSHSGYKTTLDAIAFSKKTPIISHSNCRALNDHPRCKSDEQIRALAAKGGVMGLTTVNVMVKRDLPVTMEDYLDHIDHIVKLVGIDHVGFGSDMDITGWPTDPEKKDEFLGFYGKPYFKESYRFRYPLAVDGLNHEHKWKYVTAGLLKRGYKDEQIAKVLGGNWLRVFSEVIG
ncbi:MAG TPA: dipeptidase [Vicinamibacterales bacterium]|nr:dipeptidase [Vicinamibacterales bacterium]